MDSEIFATMRRQHGLITREQALDLGLSDRQIRYRITTGEWVSAGRGLYRHRVRDVSWHVRVLAACLSVGGLASHRTAAALHVVEGFRPGVPEVVVANGRWKQIDGVRLHQTTQIDLADETTIDGIPCTGLGRTVLDLGAVVGPRRLVAAVDAVVRDRRLDLAGLFDVLVRHSRRGRDGCGRLRAVLDERLGEEAVPLSDWSRMVAGLLTGAGLPEPQLEHRVRDRAGRFVGQVDLAYPEHGVAIELDSVRWHLNRESFERDPRRRNRLVVAGWTVLCFTWSDYVDAPADLCATVAAAISRN